MQEVRNSRSGVSSPKEVGKGTEREVPAPAPGSGPGGLQGILRGGWRKYEHEGLWELPEYEEQRLKALEAFGSLRMHMEGLRPSSAGTSGAGMQGKAEIPRSAP